MKYRGLSLRIFWNIFSPTTLETDILKVNFFSPTKFYFWQFCARKWAKKTLNMLIKLVKIYKKLWKWRKNIYFPVCTSKYQIFAQNQLNFAPSHNSETVTFRNSVLKVLVLIIYWLCDLSGIWDKVYLSLLKAFSSKSLMVCNNL